MPCTNRNTCVGVLELHIQTILMTDVFSLQYVERLYKRSMFGVFLEPILSSLKENRLGQTPHNTKMGAVKLKQKCSIE